jgi:predicted HAD superfamily Cof-like phosphohydrolase
MSIFSDQRLFMIACEQMFADGLNVETSLWESLIREEYSELLAELRKFHTSPTANEKAAIAQEAIDLIYVTAGLLNNLNIPAEKVWDAVHQANLDKVDLDTGKVTRRADGKILKPPHWKAPDILSIIQEHSA